MSTVHQFCVIIALQIILVKVSRPSLWLLRYILLEADHVLQVGQSLHFLASQQHSQGVLAQWYSAFWMGKLAMESLLSCIFAIPSGAHLGVERGQLLVVLVTQLEIKNVQVLFNSGWSDALGQDAGTVLNCPPDKNLQEINKHHSEIGCRHTYPATALLAYIIWQMPEPQETRVKREGGEAETVCKQEFSTSKRKGYPLYSRL